MPFKRALHTPDDPATKSQLYTLANAGVIQRADVETAFTAGTYTQKQASEMIAKAKEERFAIPYKIASAIRKAQKLHTPKVGRRVFLVFNEHPIIVGDILGCGTDKVRSGEQVTRVARLEMPFAAFLDHNPGAMKVNENGQREKTPLEKWADDTVAQLRGEGISASIHMEAEL